MDDAEVTSTAGRTVLGSLFNQSHSENTFGQQTLLSLVAGESGTDSYCLSLSSLKTLS